MAKNTEIQSNIVDINIEIPKKKFRINGDDNRILELNTSDMNIIMRLKDAYPRLNTLAAKFEVTDYEDTGDEQADIIKLAEDWKEVDDEMRNLVDYIFQSNVSEVCATEGSMYDPYNGKFRFEWIIDTLSELYEKDLSKEFRKVTQRVQKHTNKYINK